MKKKLVLSILFVSLLVSGCNLFNFTPNDNQELNIDYSGRIEEKIFIHAMGGLGGDDYLNCQECLEYHYARGNKFFEVDLRFSSDNKIIATHNYEYISDSLLKNGLTYEEFVNFRIKGKYKGATYESLISTMQKYKDMYLVLDTKEKDEMALYTELVNQFKMVDQDLLKRVIPQFYTRDHFYQLDQVYAFPEYIYTLYKTEDSAAEILKFIEENDRVTTITMQFLLVKNPFVGENIFSRDFYNKEFTDNVVDMGKKLYFHTINWCRTLCDEILFYSGSQLEDIFEKYRITGFYTDNVNISLLKDVTKFE